jgi:hypothetical protein
VFYEEHKEESQLKAAWMLLGCFVKLQGQLRHEKYAKWITKLL